MALNLQTALHSKFLLLLPVLFCLSRSSLLDYYWYVTCLDGHVLEQGMHMNGARGSENTCWSENTFERGANIGNKLTHGCAYLFESRSEAKALQTKRMRRPVHKLETLNLNFFRFGDLTVTRGRRYRRWLSHGSGRPPQLKLGAWDFSGTGKKSSPLASSSRGCTKAERPVLAKSLSSALTGKLPVQVFVFSCGTTSYMFASDLLRLATSFSESETAMFAGLQSRRMHITALAPSNRNRSHAFFFFFFFFFGACVHSSMLSRKQLLSYRRKRRRVSTSSHDASGRFFSFPLTEVTCDGSGAQTATKFRPVDSKRGFYLFFPSKENRYTALALAVTRPPVTVTATSL